MKIPFSLKSCNCTGACHSLGYCPVNPMDNAEKVVSFSSLEAEIKQLREENDKLKGKNECNLTHIRESLLDCHPCLRECFQAVEDLNEMIRKDCQSISESLHAALAENEKLEQNVRNYKFRCHQQIREIDSLRKSIDKMNRDDIIDNPEIKQENEKLKAENEELNNTKISVLDQQHHRLREYADALKAKNKQLFDNIEELKADNKRLKSARDIEEIDYNSLYKTDEQLRGVANLSEELANNRLREIKTLKTEILRLESLYWASQQEVIQLKAQLQQMEANTARQDHKCAECKDSGYVVIGHNLNFFPCPHGCETKFTQLELTCIEKWKTDMTWGAKQEHQTFEDWKNKNECTCGCRNNMTESKPIPTRFHNEDEAVETDISKMNFKSIEIERKPQKCPVCEGKGDLYISGVGCTNANSPCFSCHGTGILREPK